MAVSAAGAGGANAGALTAGVSVMNLTTEAYAASGSELFAQNNVVISADDTTEIDQVAGSVAGAGSGAGAIAAGIGVITKNTNAYIEGGASVTALATGTSTAAFTGEFSDAANISIDSVSGV